MSMNLADVVREGQEKTLEAMELMRKEMAGTITAEEKTRLAMLNGALLTLASQAQEMGFGVAVGQGLPTENSVEDEDEDEDIVFSEYDEDEELYEDDDYCGCGSQYCGY